MAFASATGTAAKAVLAEALGVLPHGAFGALEAPDKDDDPVALDDAAHDLGRAAEVREGLAEVDVRDGGARAVDEGEEGAVRVNDWEILKMKTLVLAA